MEIYIIFSGIGMGGLVLSLLMAFTGTGHHRGGSRGGSVHSGHLHAGHMHSGNLHSSGARGGNLHGGAGSRGPAAHTGAGHAGAGHTGPGHTGPGHTGPGHTGPGHTGPGHTGSAQGGHPGAMPSGPGTDLANRLAAVKLGKLKPGKLNGKVAERVPGGEDEVPLLLRILSPFTIFTLCLGGGLTGIVAASFLRGPLVPIIAVAGAIGFEFAVVNPLSDFLLQFGGEPAGSLEGAVYSSAMALGGFDSHGKGIVEVEVDGQLRQILAQLDQDEVQRSVAVAKGDRLVVIEVDPASGRCLVSRELA